MKTTLKILMGALVLLLGALAGCAAPETPAPTAVPTLAPTAPGPLTLTDGAGAEVALPGPAQRIVSIAPSNTEILFALGAGGQVVGRDAFSDYPAEALEKADVGGGWGELNLETLLALEPDLVLAADINAPEQIQQLKDLGLAVFVLANPLSFEELYGNLQVVGQLTGRAAEAEALTASLQQRVAAVNEALAGLEERPLVFYELDATEPNAPWTAGPGTFIDMLITSAGGNNLGGTLDGAWAQISLEALVAQNPEVILLGDATWGGVTPEAVATRAGWEGLAAVQNGQVLPFDDNLVSRPGPRLVDGLEAMAKMLHPERFP